jgi:VWFA-related protein
VFTHALRALLAGLLVAAPLAAARAAEDEGISLQEVDRLYLDDVDPGAGGERVVVLYLRALSRHGEPVDDLRAAQLDIRDNGERVDPDDILPPEHLGSAKLGITWVIAIDASRTMMGDTFQRAKAAAIEFLDRVGSHDRVAIVTFAHTVDVVAEFDASRVDTVDGLTTLDVDPSGFSTLLYDGVYEAVDTIRRGHDLPRRAAVIVFSDGKDSDSQHTLDEVIQLARDSRVLVYTIGYGRFGGGGLETLARLSRETGADFQKVTSTEELNTFFSKVWQKLTRSYVIRYPWKMDGKVHTIEVSVEEQSDAYKVKYPKIAGPVWPWLAGIGGVALLVGGFLAITRLRSMGRLVFVDGPRNGEVFALPRGRVRIGAISSNDLVIPSMTVSRYHAEMRVSGKRVEIKDLHSENGTLINGNRIESAPIPLQPGDRIRIADIDLVYER